MLAIATNSNEFCGGSRYGSVDTVGNIGRDEYPVAGTVENGDVDELADALGCFTLGDAGELRFFGSSSNFSIIQNHSLRVASSVDARSRGVAAARAMPDFFEPSDELRDHLLELYWRWQNSWQYIVARESFVMDLYVHKNGRFCTPLLLTAMMGFASRYSSRPELRTNPDDANTAGEMLVAQARTMLHHEYEAPTTSTVQAAGILGLYWASLDREGLGFMYIGMASRMAMNLGLHSDCSAYIARGMISEEDVEARKIAFWGIYVLDKLYCLGMGRPAGIQEFNITTTKPKAQDRALTGLTEQQLRISQPWPTSHITENAMQMCEIFIITSEVIDQLYAQRPAWDEREKVDRITRTHLRLVKWFDELPKTLKISESSLQPSPPYVYQLHLQYHVSIILLHRPFFRVLYSRQSSGEYDPDGGDFHSRSCQASAAKISSILRIYRDNYTNRCMPISAVHPAFTAAIIHLLDLKTADLVGRRKAMRRFEVCLRSLYEMNSNWDWANRAIRATQSLATQWQVDIWASSVLSNELSQENLRQFRIHEESCHQEGPKLNSFHPGTGAERARIADPFDEFFNAWTYDQAFMDGTFDFFPED
ncbi:hypothetical protein PV08_00502 [Exophiala spinifera]|uniref:Cbl-PTB domain-containing protein n=1 Tax=Exophiala spinifera TaxID=91928 RepID=A0A0D2A559_9EURO|nr:uncharacterized protein PV08_00502 [Exophiala spinifera]KIW19927.1 hypothetical protein PV08_00502 [Exophiala spinifera]